jgi:hypothetical protein
MSCCRVLFLPVLVNDQLSNPLCPLAKTNQPVRTRTPTTHPHRITQVPVVQPPDFGKEKSKITIGSFHNKCQRP